MSKCAICGKEINLVMLSSAGEVCVPCGLAAMNKKEEKEKED